MMTFKMSLFIKTKAGNFMGSQIEFICWLVSEILMSDNHRPDLRFSNASEAVETFLLTSGYGESQHVKQLRFQMDLGLGWGLWDGPESSGPPSPCPPSRPSELPGGQFRNHFT